MSKSPFEVAREALTVLEFYSDSYASSAAFQERKEEVVSMLRSKATNYPDPSQGRQMLINLAAAFENK